MAKMHCVNWRMTPIHLNNIASAANLKSMSIRSLHRIPTRPARTATKVMVALLAGPDAPLVATPAALPRWRRLTPLALWSTVSVRDTGPDDILRGIAAEVARQDLEARQVILLAEGNVARTTLELVLGGALDCAGFIAIAVPCAALSFRIVPAAAAVRLIVQREDRTDAPELLITTLQTADIDARIVRLDPPLARATRTAASATETFVMELVANASRQVRHGG